MTAILALITSNLPTILAFLGGALTKYLHGVLAAKINTPGKQAAVSDAVAVAQTLVTALQQSVPAPTAPTSMSPDQTSK